MYIHGLLGLKDDLCTDLQKICAVKQAWFFSHENGLLSNDMYVFGIKMLKLEGEITETQLTEVMLPFLLIIFITSFDGYISICRLFVNST